MSATIEACVRFASSSSLPSSWPLVAARAPTTLPRRGRARSRRRRRGRCSARRRRNPARAIGGYSAGCIDGAVALPKVGEGFRVAKPERNRVFGHPLLVGMIRDSASGSSSCTCRRSPSAISDSRAAVRHRRDTPAIKPGSTSTCGSCRRSRAGAVDGRSRAHAAVAQVHRRGGAHADAGRDRRARRAHLRQPGAQARAVRAHARRRQIARGSASCVRGGDTTITSTCGSPVRPTARSARRRRRCRRATAAMSSPGGSTPRRRPIAKRGTRATPPKWAPRRRCRPAATRCSTRNSASRRASVMMRA